MNELEIVNHQRQIEDVTRDIRAKTCEFLRAAIEIGRLLFEAKAMVAPGEWGRYIEEELPFSHSWANNYMKLYKEYGSDQVSLFGESQAFMTLRPTQALELLALPVEDRAEFVAANNVEEMSTRQLRQAIQDQLDRERQAHAQTQTELEAAQATARNAQQDLLCLRYELAAMKNVGSELEAAMEKKEKTVRDLKEKTQQAELEVKQAQAREWHAREELEKLKANPEIPPSMMEQLRRDAEAEAARNAAEQAEARVRAAEADARAVREKLERAEKQLKKVDPDVMEFKVLLEKINADYIALDGHRRRTAAHDREVGANLAKIQEKMVSTWARALGMEVS